MASHRLPDSERPRRPVPAWVTAPFVDGATVDGAPVDGATVDDSTGREARPASAASAPVSETVRPTPGNVAAGSAPAPSSVPESAAVLDPDAVAPDYPPVQEHLPPAPMSPTVHTVPFEQLVDESSAPAPVSPIDAPALVGAPAAGPTAPARPVVPQAGQPRFSVPGLEHVVVGGTEPAPVGPVGYRTPARFAHQQAATPVPAPTAALLATPVALPAPKPEPAAVTRTEPVTRTDAVATADAGAEPSLPSDAEATTKRTARRTIGATPGSVLGAVAGIAALGLAAWWFLAPASVHAVGVALGALGLVLSIATLRNPATTWQRPIALLGAVLGGVGTLVLLWAVATAVLPMAGVPLPDITGTGTVPTLLP